MLFISTVLLSFFVSLLIIRLIVKNIDVNTKSRESIPRFTRKTKLLLEMNALVFAIFPILLYWNIYAYDKLVAISALIVILSLFDYGLNAVRGGSKTRSGMS